MRINLPEEYKMNIDDIATRTSKEGDFFPFVHAIAEEDFDIDPDVEEKFDEVVPGGGDCHLCRICGEVIAWIEENQSPGIGRYTQMLHRHLDKCHSGELLIAALLGHTEHRITTGCIGKPDLDRHYGYQGRVPVYR